MCSQTLCLQLRWRREWQVLGRQRRGFVMGDSSGMDINIKITIVIIKRKRKDGRNNKEVKGYKI